MNILKLEINNSPGYLIIWSPRFLLQAATDPAFPNKWPDFPPPTQSYKFRENILRNNLEKLQLASAKIF